MKTVCIKDIAKESGVSITTVSLILNNKASTISEETIKRVQSIAKEMGYRPNAIASSLKTKKTKLIGYVMPSIENSFFSEIAKKVEKIIEKKGYSIVICSSDDKFEKDYNLIEMLSSRMIDLLLYCPSVEALEKDNLTKIISLLHSIDIPYIIVDRQIEGDLHDKVVCDDRKGALDAVEYLIASGHERIACITGPLSMSSASNRFFGYQEALKKNRIPYDSSLIRYGAFDYASGYEAGKSLARSDATAIFVCNDLMAYGAIKALKESGKSVPEDVSLIGYDDLFFSALLDTPLTTVHQDIDALGKAIGNNILSILEDNVREIPIQVIPPSLVIRSTVKRRKNK